MCLMSGSVSVIRVSLSAAVILRAPQAVRSAPIHRRLGLTNLRVRAGRSSDTKRQGRYDADLRQADLSESVSSILVKITLFGVKRWKRMTILLMSSDRVVALITR